MINQDSIFRRVFVAVVLFFSGAIAFGTGVFMFSREPDASRWFSVDSILVRDSVVGISPGMSVSRTIYREFRGNWTVTVNRQDEDRGFYTFCTASGSAIYQPDLVIPASANLDWWTWPTKCDLPEGVYQVDTTWSFHPPGYSIKEVNVTSNIFTVRSGASPRAAP